MRTIGWLMGWNWGAKEHPSIELFIYTQDFIEIWSQAFISGGERRCIKVSHGVKLGCKIAPAALSPFLYTILQWNLARSSTGAERKWIKPIRICARSGDLRGEIWVQISTRDIISCSTHRIFMIFGHTLHLWYRNVAVLSTSKSPRLGVLWGEIGVQKSTQSIISIYTQYF